MDELRTPRRVRNYPQNCKGSTNKKFIYYGGFWCFCSEYFWFCCEIVCFGLDCPIFLDSGPIFTPFRPKYSWKIGRSDTLQVALQETCRMNAKYATHLYASNFSIKTPSQNPHKKSPENSWKCRLLNFHKVFGKFSACSSQHLSSNVRNTLFDHVVPQYFIEKYPWRAGGFLSVTRAGLARVVCFKNNFSWV